MAKGYTGKSSCRIIIRMIIVEMIRIMIRRMMIIKVNNYDDQVIITVVEIITV